MRALQRVREVTPVLGAFLIGISIGVFAIGIQIPVQCFEVAGQASGQLCGVLRWGDRVSLWAGLLGSVSIGVALVSEWRLQEVR